MMRIPTRVRGRFARSVRLDRSTPDALDGYVPTARALDVIRRVVRGMTSPDGSRAFSITGPYGSGKSSFAVFLSALCASDRSEEYRRAVSLLAEYDAEVAAMLPDARAAMGAPTSGFARAVITAPQREPVAATVLRALDHATRTTRSSAALRRQVTEALARAVDARLATPSYGEIHDLVAAVTARCPLLLVIDEFGKNLEAYSDSGADGDMYLLQELAEWASNRSDGVPMVLVTIQHLAFEAYAAAATTAKRREWAKVQGRFEDIPFVDSASATRNLVAVALDHGDDASFEAARRDLADRAASQALAVGLPEVAAPGLIAACWPLHPSTLLVLPELCARYGQNERTLFSFLASPEPLSVASWVARHDSVGALGWIRLDQIYDYFVESTGSFLTVSSDATRWNEIATAIRDAHGLTDGQRRVVKAVGVLNLVAATGMLRASRAMLAFACADGREGTEDEGAVALRLDELAALGLVTHRDYAQEFRIWRGSDFDINGALRSARRAVRERSTATLLTDIRPMPPLVAARHSTRTGTVRAFARVYADTATRTVTPPAPGSVYDGLLVYRLDDTPISVDGDARIPVVTVDARDLSAVREAARELAALVEVADDPALPGDDHTARRELAERTAHARLDLDRLVTLAFDNDATWMWTNPPDGAAEVLTDGVASARLSDVLDRAYDRGPEAVAYEAINRAQLTSAGARARRLVQAALVDPTRHREPQLGLDGDGAEVAMYRAVIVDSGIHTPGAAKLAVPTPGSGWRAVWDAMLAEIVDVDAPVTVDYLFSQMMAPPYGLRDGIASLLLTAMLVVEAANLTVYEHGTFRPQLTAPVVERLVRNPQNFAVKHLGTIRRGPRQQLIDAIHDALDTRQLGGRPEDLTLLSTVQRLVAIYHDADSTYMAKTRAFIGPEPVDPTEAERAAAVRDALAEAREPDVLLFTALPTAVDAPAIGPARKTDDVQIGRLAHCLAAAVHLLATANERLALAIFDRVTHAALSLHLDGKLADRTAVMRTFEASAEAIVTADKLPPDVRAFVQACLMHPSTPAELGTQIATTVTGTSPRDWDDHTTPRHLDELATTARVFRRFSDLARAAASHERGDGLVHAYAVTITSAAGRTVDRTITLRNDYRRDVTAAVDVALDRLAHLGDHALDALLAGVTAAAAGEHGASTKNNHDAGDG